MTACLQCGAETPPLPYRGPPRRYCSAKCSKAWWRARLSLAARHYSAHLRSQGGASAVAEVRQDLARKAIPVGWDARLMRGHGPNGLATDSERQAAQAPRHGTGKPKETAPLLAEPKGNTKPASSKPTSHYPTTVAGRRARSAG